MKKDNKRGAEPIENKKDSEYNRQLLYRYYLNLYKRINLQTRKSIEWLTSEPEGLKIIRILIVMLVIFSISMIGIIYISAVNPELASAIKFALKSNIQASLSILISLLIALRLYIYLQAGSLNDFFNNIPVPWIRLGSSFKSPIKYSEWDINHIWDSWGIDHLIENKEVKSIDSEIESLAEKKITDDFFLEKLEWKFWKNILNSSRSAKIDRIYSILEARLTTEITNLRRSSNINLTIGIFATAFAIIILWYDIFSVEINFSDTTAVLSHYIPRISIVIFIEIFAFFFLRLYKNGLLDIKYYNNEKTNIDFKILAITASLWDDTNHSYSDCISKLISTERNATLEVGTTTSEIEKSKIEKEMLKDLYSILEKIPGKVKW